jgi:hypothetical protein
LQVERRRVGLGGENQPEKRPKGLLKLILDFNLSKDVGCAEFRERIFMQNNERETLIRQYAAGKVTWHDLQERGFDNYVQVLGGLGELGLRPPIAPMEGPNRAARERGRSLIRGALKAHP